MLVSEARSLPYPFLAKIRLRRKWIAYNNIAVITDVKGFISTGPW